MTVRSKHLKIVGAMGAAALTVGSMAAASPALAAGSTMTFSCALPLGDTSATLTPANIPAKLVAGQASKTNMTVVIHLTSGQTTIASALGTKISGSVTAKGQKSTIAYKVTFPSTTVDTGNAQDITATGKATITAPKAGKYTLNAGAITATIKGNGGGAPVSQACAPPTDNSKKLGTIAVSKDKSKSKVSAKAKGKKATVTDKVAGKHGLKATGKVKFTLKKGSKTVKATGKLSKKGVAKISKTLTSGKWSISAAFKGDKNLKSSTGTGSVTVK